VHQGVDHRGDGCPRRVRPCICVNNLFSIAYNRQFDPINIRNKHNYVNSGERPSVFVVLVKVPPEHKRCGSAPPSRSELSSHSETKSINSQLHATIARSLRWVNSISTLAWESPLLPAAPPPSRLAVQPRLRLCSGVCLLFPVRSRVQRRRTDQQRRSALVARLLRRPPRPATAAFSEPNARDGRSPLVDCELRFGSSLHRDDERWSRLTSAPPGTFR
jgi:hypothetical protein